MPSRRDVPPTPTELAAWLRVASPRTARGRSLWSPAGESWRSRFTYAGRRPVMAHVPAEIEVAFWHAAPGRWRVDAPEGPVCRSDGTTAVGWTPGGVDLGGALLVFHGPPDLLHPVDAHRGDELDGTVTLDELLGRRCWRWERPASTVWVDEATGCALRIDSPDGRLELTAFEADVDLDPDLFSTPADVLAGARPTEPPPSRPGQVAEPPPGREQPRAPFRVVWWPHGVAGEAVAGDPAVPDVLLQLVTDGERSSPQVWLGVAPAGREPRVQPRAAVRRWEGDGWSFALSWRGELPAEDVDRLVASTPRTWDVAR